MEKKEISSNEYLVIDVKQIFRTLWEKAWVILLVSILCGGAMLAFTRFLIAPKYAADVMLYVNNRATDDGKDSVSQTDLTAAQSLVKTYVVILRNNTTLQQIIDLTGVNRTCDELKKMISAEAVNETEVFRVTVTSESPEEATQLAHAIVEILPARVEYIIKDSTMRLVDDNSANVVRVSPNLTKNTIMGALIGFVGACVLFLVIAMLDDTIRDEDYLTQNYEVPILAKIPDLMAEEPSGRKYSYYKRYKSEYKKTVENEEKSATQKETR